MALPLDVMNKQQIADAVKAAEARFGAIDVLVNNAGYGYRAAVEEGDDAEVRRLFDVNVFGLIDVTKAVLPGMRKARKGHIINVSSVAGRLALPGVADYAASQARGERIVGRSRQGSRAVRHQGDDRRAGPVAHRFPQPLDARRDSRPSTTTRRPPPASRRHRSKAVQKAGGQGGDPVRIAEAIVKVTEMNEPPLHLLLGAITLDRVRPELEARLSELDEWAEVLKNTDFPG